MREGEREERRKKTNKEEEGGNRSGGGGGGRGRREETNGNTTVDFLSKSMMYSSLSGSYGLFLSRISSPIVPSHV